MSVTYAPAPQVENIAGKLIPKHHDHLADVGVEYVFRSEHAERHGHVVLGKARKVSGLNAFLVHRARIASLNATVQAGDGPKVPLQDTLATSEEPFFVIEIAQDLWAVLDSGEREALIDHELSHCRTKLNKDGEVVLFVAPHDLEEFNQVVERRGLWRKNLRSFLKAAKAGQPTLWAEIDEDENGDATVHDLMAARG